MSPRTRRCTDAITRGRLEKAEQFGEAAEIIRAWTDEGDAALGDAFVTLCVHAGIAAADVVCCTVLGEHARGDEHTEALLLVGRVRPNGRELANALSVLLSAKTRAGYGHQPVPKETRIRAARAMKRLVREAHDRASG